MAYARRAWAALSGRVRWGRMAVVASVGGVAFLATLALFPPSAAVGNVATPSAFAQSPSRLLNDVDARRAPPTTTTVPTTVPAPVPTTTLPRPAPTPRPTPTPASTTLRGIVPPQNPSANIAPSPNFLTSCSGSAYDDSAGCVNASVAAINNARTQEGLPGMTLPSNWTSLTAPQQIFVTTNLERTVRGLAPLSAMATSLDQSAQQGAASDQDPSPVSGFPYSVWGANWSGALGNPLEAMYMWMYDDGVSSTNIDCSSTNTSGCWGHRDNVLRIMSCAPCVMGAGFAPGAYQGTPSMTELLVSTSGSPAADFTWQQEQPFL